MKPEELKVPVYFTEKEINDFRWLVEKLEYDDLSRIFLERIIKRYEDAVKQINI